MHNANSSGNTGSIGERIASKFLVGKRHRVLDVNYRRPWGEIDIVTEKDGIVHIIEVKTKEVSDFSRERNYEPEELVNKVKLRKIVRTAETYMTQNNDTREYQIDVVAVLLNKNTLVARCKYIEQVIEDL